MARARTRRRAVGRPIAYLKRVGPGIVSGASDNDPTTVATLSVAGAATAFSLSWLVVLVLPMLAAVQVCAAQVGVVARKGLQAAVRDAYGRGWGAVLLVAVVAVNLVTIVADLEAGAAALGLVVPIDFRWFVVPYGALVAFILFKGAYDEVERILKFVVLVFVAYVGAAFLARPNWGQVALSTLVPHASVAPGTIQAMLAILGTTLTSYAYVWEAQGEAESEKPLGRLRLAKLDAGLGMLAAAAIFWFTLIAVGATLGVHHKPVQSAQDAAAALTPVAGPAAAYLFAAGLLASSFIAVPVLAATCGYLLGDELDRPTGLSLPVREAPIFYATLGSAIVLAVGVALAGIPAISLLFWASVAGGLGTPISLVFLLLVARNPKVMGDHRVGTVPYAVGWATAVIVSAVSLYFLWDEFGSKLVRL